MGTLPRTFVKWEILSGYLWGHYTTFRSGRNFAAWLGLVPRQFSSGGKERLGRVSKAGQADIRRLLIIGAMSHVRVASRKPAATGSWLARMLARKPKMLVAIALANKMARRIWAMLTKTGRLPRTSVAGGGMIHAELNTLMPVKEV